MLSSYPQYRPLLKIIYLYLILLRVRLLAITSTGSRLRCSPVGVCGVEPARCAGSTPHTPLFARQGCANLSCIVGENALRAFSHTIHERSERRRREPASIMGIRQAPRIAAFGSDA